MLLKIQNNYNIVNKNKRINEKQFIKVEDKTKINKIKKKKKKYNKK